MERINLYDIKGFSFKIGDTVKWNSKIFKECPFKVDEVKTISEIRNDFIGLNGIRMWWNWWELVPTNVLKKTVYYIKFYHWYYTRFKKL